MPASAMSRNGFNAGDPPDLCASKDVSVADSLKGSGSESACAYKDLLSGEQIDRSLKRIAFEILEKNQGDTQIVLLGIPTRGVYLAERLSEILRDVGTKVPSGSLDITLYRDDLARQPARVPDPTVIPQGGIDGKTVIIVDDVLYSGRTVRAALDALLDIGRPARVQLAVLVDRGHRELPIRADYVGKNLPTSRDEQVNVLLVPFDQTDAVRIVTPS